MPIPSAQKTAIEEVINKLKSVTQGGRYKRSLIDAFLELPDREEYPDYYKVIPEPRCITDIQQKLAQDQYENCLTAFEDLALVFLNALYYNEDDSQIAADADKLKGILTNEWKGRQVLPTPRDSPPPEAPQKKNHPPAPAPIVSAPSLIPAPSSIPAPTSALKQTPASTSNTPTTRSATAAAMPAPAPTVPAPAAVPTPAPALRPLSVRPRSPTPEMDIDVERGSPEPEGGAGEEEARDEDTHAIVSQLERGLPGWPGFDDVGWSEELREEQFLEIITVLKNHKDPMTNVRLAASLEAIPEDLVLPDLPYKDPLSWKLIESKARSKGFASSKEFDMEVTKLFLKGRRYYETSTENYGRVLLLQRFYQALTSPSPPSGPPYVSSSNFASLRAGPGTARPLYSSASDGDGGVPGVTTFRVSSRDRTFVDELCYKGWRLHLADWVHMANPDDPSRPIVGHIFRCYISEEAATKGRPGLTVCWYYRPEQTVHPAHRLFWENEVFKTSHFADHTLEDLIEKIAVQFTARHIRGRPRPPHWSRGWPLYVCDSRYNDRERCFVRIKNWQSCVPEEVRGARARGEWMPVYPFERLVYPRRLSSPFVARNGVPRAKGPGGLGDPIERAEGERTEGGGTGRKRARKGAGGAGGGGPASLTDMYGPQKGPYAGGGPVPTPFVQPQPAATQHSHQHHPQQQTQQRHHTYSPQPAAQYQQQRIARIEDRSLLQAAGGAAVAASLAVETLPSETAKFFDRDAQTNEVLWFAAPPMNVVRTPAPQYSLAYLHFLAAKRKRVADATGEAGEEASKRARVETTAEVTGRASDEFIDVA